MCLKNYLNNQKPLDFLRKSLIITKKAGKMRTKMRSRVHVVLVRVSEFHPCGKNYGTHPTAYDSGLLCVLVKKVISADAEILIQERA